jgi:hypothetical protein
MTHSRDVEKLILQTQRVARLIWRHTPPLRSAVERDDWLQSAAVEILSITEEVTEELMTRSLRALAQRLIYKTEKDREVVSVSPEVFDKLEAPVADTPVDTSSLCWIPNSRANHRRGHKRKIHVGGEAILKLLQEGHSVDETACILRISRQSVYKWLRKTKEAASSNKPETQGGL